MVARRLTAASESSRRTTRAGHADPTRLGGRDEEKPQQQHPVWA